jgi:hypothetical protein
MHSEETFSVTALVQKPEVCPGGREGRRNVADLMVAQVGKEVIEDWNEEESVGCEE